MAERSRSRSRSPPRSRGLPGRRGLPGSTSLPILNVFGPPPAVLVNSVGQRFVLTEADTTLIGDVRQRLADILDQFEIIR